MFIKIELPKRKIDSSTSEAMMEDDRRCYKNSMLKIIFFDHEFTSVRHFNEQQQFMVGNIPVFKDSKRANIDISTEFTMGILEILSQEQINPSMILLTNKDFFIELREENVHQKFMTMVEYGIMDHMDWMYFTGAMNVMVVRIYDFAD